MKIEQRYTCWGSVRGHCGHIHETVGGAERCVAQDNRGCAKSPHLSGSDRWVYRATEAEIQEWAASSSQSGPGERMDGLWDDEPEESL